MWVCGGRGAPTPLVGVVGFWGCGVCSSSLLVVGVWEWGRAPPIGWCGVWVCSVVPAPSAGVVGVWGGGRTHPRAVTLEPGAIIAV